MSDEKDKTTIKLEKDEAALIMSSKGDIKIVFPDLEGHENTPEYVQYVSAMAVICTTDLEVVELIWNKFNALVDEEKERQIK